MKPFFLPLLLLSHAFLYSQMNVDSLKRALFKEKTDSLTIIRKLQLIETTSSAETEPLLVIGNWGLEKAKAIKNHYLEAYAQMALGFAYLYTDRVTEETGNHFTSALRISEPNGYHDITAQTYNGLAHVYGMARQTEKYEEFTLKSIEASRQANLLIGVANGYAVLAATFFQKRNENIFNIRKAIQFQQQANEAAELLKDSLNLIVYYLNISNYYAEINAFDSAEYFLGKSKIIIDTNRSGNDYMRYYYWKGSMFFKKKDNTAALDNYHIAVTYARQYKSRSFEIRIYQALIKAYKESGDFKQAIYYLEQTKAYDDSVVTKQNFAKAADIQNKYEREKKDNEITRLNATQLIRQLQLEKQKAIIAGNLLEAQKKENEIQLLSRQKELQDLRITEQEKELEKNILQAKADAQQIQLAERNKQIKEKQLRNQEQIRNILLAGLGMLSILSFVLIKNMRAKNIAYKQLERKSIQIQEQALQLSKQAKLIAQFQSQMNPHFVYNALHNIQGLVLGHETQKANTQIQSLAQLMRKTFANAEKDDIPLEEEISYLQKYIEFERTAFDNTLDFEVTVDKKAEHALIPPMMIQPFVENAVKHAELQKVKNPFIKVLIEIENNLLAISVKDNGLGIKKDLNESDRLSHSVSVIKSRLNLIFKGIADVESKPVFSIKSIPEITEGTTVKFYLPLNYPY